MHMTLYKPLDGHRITGALEMLIFTEAVYGEHVL